ncbi:hypothetical protein DITRI_Ditri04bG0069400 [Diplodiscus trichospermus]
MGTAIGESIGNVETMETRSTNMAWGKWLRVRAYVNVTKRLKRRRTMTLSSRGWLQSPRKSQNANSYQADRGKEVVVVESSDSFKCTIGIAKGSYS